MDSEKRNYRKIIAMALSLTLHLAGIYYLGTVALDYALPKGSVDSMEVSYDINQGIQSETTDISVVETQGITKQIPKPAPAETVAKPITKTTKPAIPTTLPSKENVAEEAQPTLDDASPVIVPTPTVDTTTPTTNDHDDLIKDTYENDKTKDNAPVAESTTESAIEPVAISNDSEQPTASTSEEAPAPVESVAQTAQPYGRPEGVQSDRVLTPLPGNRSITYPTMARLRRLEGTTVVHYNVSGEGVVTDVKVIQSSGSSILDNQAIESIKTWKFKPTGEAGIYERPIRFKLSGDEQQAPSQLRRLNN